MIDQYYEPDFNEIVYDLNNHRSKPNYMLLTVVVLSFAVVTLVVIQLRKPKPCEIQPGENQ